MILVWSRKAIAESLRTWRSCRETEEPVNNWLWLKFGNLHSLQLSRDLQQFLFFVNHGYAHISLLCFPLVMLSASHWVLAQARFCGHTHLPLSPNSTTATGQGDIPISLTGCTCFNIHRIHSTCGHGDISAITLLILSLSRCSYLNIHWYTAPVDMMTFRWSRRSYQSICQQHPPYSHPQVTLIYYNTQGFDCSTLLPSLGVFCHSNFQGTSNQTLYSVPRGNILRHKQQNENSLPQ